MSTYELILSGAAALVLFGYGLHALSREIEGAGGAEVRDLIGRLTKSPWRAYALGLAVTAVIQSSSAISAFAVSLVDAGAIGLQESFPLLLGANVGSTVTAWLVSFKLSGAGAALILLGLAISRMPWRWSAAGRGVFYFGLILFSLDLVSYAIRPLRDEPAMQSLIALARTPLIGLLIGAVVTAVVQSSSLVVGLGVLFAKDGVLEPAAVVPIVVGANLGSTATALLASLGMGVNARRAAVANALFNALGVAVVLPVLQPVSALLASMVGDPGMAVAWAHLSFNLLVTALGFAAMRPIGRLVARLA